MAYKRKFAKKTYSKKSKPYAKKGVPKKKSKLVALIKKTVLKTSESKNLPYDHGKIELYHNSGSPASGRILPASFEIDAPYVMPVQGLGDTNRIGDSIYVSGMKVRMLIGQKYDRPNVTFRIMCVKVTNQDYPATVAQLFDNTTGNVLLDTVNNDRVKTVYHKTIKMQQSTLAPGIGGTYTTKEYTFTHSFYISAKRKIDFTTNGGTSFARSRHYVFVFAYDAYGTLVTDNIAYVQGYSNLYFRDP